MAHKVKTDWTSWGGVSDGSSYTFGGLGSHHRFFAVYGYVPSGHIKWGGEAIRNVPCRIHGISDGVDGGGEKELGRKSWD